MKLGEWLTMYRAKNGLTMQILADACGFSKAYLSMLEKGINPQTGKPYSPTMQTFEKIAKGTGTDVDTLFKILDDDQPITLNPSPKILNHEETQLVDCYRILNNKNKQLVRDVIFQLGAGTKIDSFNSNTANNGCDIKNNFVAFGGKNSVSQKVTVKK